MKPHNRRLLNEDVSSTTASGYLSPEFYPTPPQTPTNDSVPRKPLRPISTFDSSMALTIVVLLAALFFMGFFSIYIRRISEENAVEASRRRRQQRRARSSSATHGLDPSTIQSLPMFTYDGSCKEPDDCAICLSEFVEQETVKAIPCCEHAFHPECIDMWLASHGSCPLCRSTQLFSKKKACLNVLEVKRADGGGARSVGIGESSMESGQASMRRVSSCSSGLGERVLLRRSWSF